MNDMFFAFGVISACLIAASAAYFVFCLFILPLAQAVSLVLLAIYASLVNKRKICWHKAFPMLWNAYFKTFLFDSSASIKIRSNDYLWFGVFKWVIYRNESEKNDVDG
ncbi:MAG: hypothetical protein CTY38_00860 [Methylotenera sp.]|uniref:hypothetical protein n=1 Tax=Methylotenera sp. TaxID=2051956 RepID=UPI000D456428|nr:hypothetical protein [Methylotenera sp.]PPC84628.1 MAG: hypothetical protein CTY38_00860 [Methylotenera sp.]